MKLPNYYGDLHWSKAIISSCLDLFLMFGSFLLLISRYVIQMMGAI